MQFLKTLTSSLKSEVNIARPYRVSFRYSVEFIAIFMCITMGSLALLYGVLLQHHMTWYKCMPLLSHGLHSTIN